MFATRTAALRRAERTLTCSFHSIKPSTPPSPRQRCSHACRRRPRDDQSSLKLPFPLCQYTIVLPAAFGEAEASPGVTRAAAPAPSAHADETQLCSPECLIWIIPVAFTWAAWRHLICLHAVTSRVLAYKVTLIHNKCQNTASAQHADTFCLNGWFQQEIITTFSIIHCK